MAPSPAHPLGGFISAPGGPSPPCHGLQAGHWSGGHTRVSVAGSRCVEPHLSPRGSGFGDPLYPIDSTEQRNGRLGRKKVPAQFQDCPPETLRSQRSPPTVHHKGWGCWRVASRIQHRRMQNVRVPACWAHPMLRSQELCVPHCLPAASVGYRGAKGTEEPRRSWDSSLSGPQAWPSTPQSALTLSPALPPRSLTPLTTAWGLPRWQGGKQGQV